MPTDSADTYQVIDPFYGVDGLRSLVDHVARNAITTERRRFGMICFTQNDGAYWQLQPSPWSMDDSDWLPLTGFGGTITLTGDATGVGTTSIVTTVASFNGGTAFGTMAAQNASSVAITGGTITGLGTPLVPSDAANKAYVDSATSGLTFIPPGCRVATTGALTATYANGTLGVGATLTNATTQAAIAIDGVTLSLNDIVLVKNQASTFQNGIYKATTLGDGTHNWVLTRVTNYDQTSEVVQGSYVVIGAGTANVGTLWIMTAATPITIGTNPITFTTLVITGSGTVTNVATGAGLTGGPISSTGTIAFAAVADQRILANISGGSLAPSANTLTAIIDSVVGSAQGEILYRGASTWDALDPGTSGQFLQTQGASSDVQWADAAGGTVTSVAAGTGLAGGTITTTGTLSLATIADQRVFANVSGGAAVPSATTISDVLDIASSTQGVILYRDAAGWLPLAPGTTGQILATQGAGANPQWITAASTGTVTNVATGSGLTGGPITSTGTIALATVVDSRILANVSGITAAPTANTLSAILDIAGTAQGDILYRNATVWVVLAPGTSGQVLTSQGSAANLQWATPTTGTVTSVATGSGLTGGTITTTGTLALAAITNNTVLANVSGGSLAPSSTTPTLILDVIGATQGQVLYRGASAWTALAVGTNGQVLASQGTAANPHWVDAGPATTTLTGDATGTGSGTFATTVVKINGATLGTTTATAGNLLIGSGAAWVTQAMTGDATITSGGVFSINNLAVTTAKINTAAVTFAKIQNVAGLSLIGNATASPAVPTNILTGTGFSFSGATLSVLGPRVFTWILGLGADLVSGLDFTNWLVCSKAGTFTRVDMVIKVAPIGADIIIDIKKASSPSGTFTSLWASTPANRPTIASAANIGTFGAFDPPATFAAGDILRIDVIQVGIGTAGQYLTVELLGSMAQ